MAVTITPLGLAGSLKIIRDADSDATSESNVADGAATVYAVTIDNTANGAATYTKFYNSAAPVVGTTDPEMVLMTPSSKIRTFVFKGGIAGIFTTALSFASVTAGGTAGTTNPVADAIVDIVVG